MCKIVPDDTDLVPRTMVGLIHVNAKAPTENQTQESTGIDSATVLSKGSTMKSNIAGKNEEWGDMNLQLLALLAVCIFTMQLVHSIKIEYIDIITMFIEWL